jgi:hypothetical protein
VIQIILRRVPGRAFLGLLVGFVFAWPVVAGERGARFRLASPIMGVHPGAPPAIAPSFAYSLPRSRVPRYGRSTKSGAPVVYVAPPAYYEPPIHYVDPPPAAEAPPVSAPPPVPPPPEREVIQYPDGRYELRGDGVGTPYRWVWIPNPPPRPPPKPGSDPPLYGWIDERGALHVTDRWDAIPQEYRAQARRNRAS